MFVGEGRWKGEIEFNLLTKGMENHKLLVHQGGTLTLTC